MNDDELFRALGFVKVSQFRIDTLKAIGNSFKMPSEIAGEIDLTISQVSRILIGLKNENIVLCINEDMRKGRLYKCTQLGIEVLKNL